MEPLPQFRDVPVVDRQQLFLRKVQLCSASQNAREKEVKRQTLFEIIEFITSGTGRLPDHIFEAVVDMISKNLFRSLPPTQGELRDDDGMEFDEDDPALEPAWSHLQIVYEFLLRLVVSSETEPRTARRFIDGHFVSKLLALFNSEDPRERDYLKTILHRIYAKFMAHRVFIRKAINNIFYQFIFETEKHNGIAELLEILGSIINGFALPLKEEHKIFLQRALIPLHKPKSLAIYHQPLTYCVTQFVEKDPRLAEDILRGLLKYWPVTNSHKEVLFLNELEEILEMTQAEEFQNVQIPLFRRLSKCISSVHFQVAERSLFLWRNEYIVTLIAQNKATILPTIFSSLERNSRDHWNQTVHGLTNNVRRMFMELDNSLFQECLTKFEADEEAASAKERSREQRWEQVQALASERQCTA